MSPVLFACLIASTAALLAPPAPAVSERGLAWHAEGWSATLSGFLESDIIWDSTQSFNDLVGNAAIARPDTYAGRHSRTMFSVRNSRLDLQVGYEREAVKSHARVEVDFLGNQPPGVAEAAFFENPTPRMRHFYATMDFGHVELLAGQTWQLLGSQPLSQVNTVLIQGTPGMLYGRAPQIRLQGSEGDDTWAWYWAVAASRPPARDAGLPDAQAGMRIAYLPQQGIHTVAATTTETAPLTLGISGVLRDLAVARGAQEATALGYGWSVDAFVPLMAPEKSRAHHLAMNLAYLGGAGIADMFTNLTGGAPAVTDIDMGLVGIDSNGTPHPIAWQAVLVGLQYYLPPEGQLWLAINGSYMNSSNMASFGAPAQAFKESWWANVTLMADLNAHVRLGLDVSSFWQRYVDNVLARNLRAQFSTFYVL